MARLRGRRTQTEGTEPRGPRPAMDCIASWKTEGVSPMSKNRLEAFSDGVFAIVITLLILDVRFPADKPLTLETLRGMAPHVLAFVLSFIIVGVYWVSHHNMLHFIKQVDRQLLWLNLVLLLVIVFIPFPAALLGQHLDSKLAVALYGGNLMLVNAAGTAMWLYATSR